MLRLFRYLKPYVLPVILLVALVYVQVSCDLLLPDYMSAMVDQGVMMGQMDTVRTQGLKMLAAALGSMACTVMVGYIAARVGAGFSTAVRRDVFAKVESFSPAEFDKFSTASLITRSTNDVQQVQMIVIMGLRMAVAAPLTGVRAVLKALEKGQSLTWIMALAVVAVTLMVLLLFFIAVPKFKVIQQKVDRLNLATRENLTGLRVIRAFNTQAREEQKFDEANRDLMGIQLFVNRLMSLMFPFMMVIMNLTALGIMWLGAHMIGEGLLQIGDMMAFIQYAMQVIMSFLMLTMMLIMAPRALVSGARVMQVLDTPSSVKDPPQPKRPSSALRGVVEFRDVSFAYPGAEEAVLENISFTAHPGQTTALIGSTGSGKSTLANLVPRFFDVTSGTVLVNGQDVRDYALEDLCQRIGYVPQQGLLFSGTVASNIRFGAPDAPDDAVRQAAEVAQAQEFIEKLEEGYDSSIAQGGQNVSGGQRQRLAIARAIVRNPEIYIFDDSFSALDFKTDAALRAALAQHTREAAVLVVAQRVATILSADQIVVLDKGRLAGIGTHKELLASCQVYREIALSQLSEEELA